MKKVEEKERLNELGYATGNNVDKIKHSNLINKS